MIRNFLLLYFCFINLCQASDFKTIQQQRQEMENAFAKVSIEFEEYFDKKDFYQEFFNLEQDRYDREKLQNALFHQLNNTIKNALIFQTALAENFSHKTPFWNADDNHKNAREQFFTDYMIFYFSLYNQAALELVYVVRDTLFFKGRSYQFNSMGLDMLVGNPLIKGLQVVLKNSLTSVQKMIDRPKAFEPTAALRNAMTQFSDLIDDLEILEHYLDGASDAAPAMYTGNIKGYTQYQKKIKAFHKEKEAKLLACIDMTSLNYVYGVLKLDLADIFYAAANCDKSFFRDNNLNAGKGIFQILPQFFNEYLENGFMNNVTLLKKLEMPGTVFSGLPLIELLFSSLNGYLVALEIIQHPQTTDNAVIADSVPVETTTTVQALPNYGDEIEPGSTIEEHEDEPLTEEDYSEYFRNLHHEFQRKKSADRQKNERQVLVAPKLTAYQKGLYTFLLDNVFSNSSKLSWKELVKDLAAHGFSGTANRTGNGSTWIFTVNHKNQLFKDVERYNKAFFNVHKFKGNNPIHRAYLSYFRSGFEHIFGLSPEAMTSALKDDAARR